jgi:hypothetical protein
MNYPGDNFAAVTPAAPFIRDAQGFIWVGLSYYGFDEYGGGSSSIGGMSRFDGREWTRYNHKNLPFNPGFVHDFLVDRSGSLWAATATDFDFSGRDGAIRLDGGTWKLWYREENKNNPQNNTAYVLHQDRTGTIWVGTKAGVRSFDGVNWKTYTEADGLPKGAVFSLLEDRNGTLWALSAPVGGLSRFDGMRWVQEADLPDPYVTCMVCDISGSIWVGSRDGVSRLNPTGWKMWKCGEEINDGYVTTIAIHPDSLVWVGLSPKYDDEGREWGGGLTRFDGVRWSTWTDADGLISNTISCILVDNTQAVWVGTSSGISRFMEKKTSVGDMEEKPTVLSIHSISPNPFNGSASIELESNTDGAISLDIFSLSGQKIRTLVRGQLTMGIHRVSWNGKDDYGRLVSSGVYIGVLKKSGQLFSRKMLLLR